MLPVVTRLNALRAHGHPLLLIGVWSLLEVATIVWTAQAPGSPFYADGGPGTLGGAVLITTVVVLFVALGSQLAWWIAIFDTLGIVLGVLTAILELGVKPIGVILLQAAALWLIWSPSVATYVQSGRRGRIPVVPPQAH